MAVQPIVRMGSPLLLQQAKPVDQFNSPELTQLITDMLDTMHHYNGVGIAAPQIGVSKQIFIYEVEHNPRYPNMPDIPLHVVINPSYQPLSETTDDAWEGCLSVPGMRGLVSRYTQIQLTAYNQYGEPFEREVYDHEARIIQHEGDHLNGILYPMRINDLRNFGFSDVLFN